MQFLKNTPSADFYTGHDWGTSADDVSRGRRATRGARLCAVLTGLAGAEVRVTVTAGVLGLDHHLQLQQLGLRSATERVAASLPPAGLPEHVLVVSAEEAQAPGGP